MVYGTTSYNKRYTLRPLRGLGLRKNPVGLRPLWCFAPAHFFVPVKLLTQFLLSGTKKRQLPRTLCTIICVTSGKIAGVFCILKLNINGVYNVVLQGDKAF